MNKHWFSIIAYYILVVSFTLTTSSCSRTPKSGNPKTVNKADLIGEWMVVNAKRNDISTSLLNKTFFHFTADSLDTNLPTQSGKNAYTWIDYDIAQNTDPPVFYSIHYLQKDSLSLFVELQSVPFELYLKRLNDSTPIQ